MDSVLWSKTPKRAAPLRKFTPVSPPFLTQPTVMTLEGTEFAMRFEQKSPIIPGWKFFPEFIESAICHHLRTDDFSGKRSLSRIGSISSEDCVFVQSSALVGVKKVRPPVEKQKKTKSSLIDDEGLVFTGRSMIVSMLAMGMGNKKECVGGCVIFWKTYFVVEGH